MRRKSTVYEGDNFCDYCEIHKASHTLVCGKLCCSSTAGNCKEVRARAGKKISTSRNIVNSNGLTNSQIIAKKISQNKRNSIDSETGLNKHQITAIKVAQNKTLKIDPVSGMNTHQLTAAKYSQWSKSADGIEYGKISGKKLSDKLKQVDTVTGLSESQRRAKIMIETKLNSIDEFGLNSFDRTHWVGGKGGFIDGIYFQSSNEKRFLELMKITGSLQNFRRGSKIEYNCEGTMRCYLPDYIVNEKTLFEVKSTYTMFGKDNKFLKNNVAKLLAAESYGYDVFIVLDDKIIPFQSFIRSVSNLLES